MYGLSQQQQQQQWAHLRPESQAWVQQQQNGLLQQQQWAQRRPESQAWVQQQNGLLQQQQWAQLRPESQAWGSGVFPPSQQGLIQANLVQQHVQRQVAYHQDLRSGSVGLNGVPLPQQVHRGGGDHGLRGSQQWANPHDGRKGQYGAAPMPQDSRRPQDGMRAAEFPRGGGSYGGGGHSYGNGNSRNKPYSKNDRTSGNRSRGGGGGGGGGPAPNPRFKGGKNEKGGGRVAVRSQQAGGSSLRCDACDGTFKNSQQFTAHNNAHIKCDVEGCSFEASGRVVKEHKQTAHDRSASDVQGRSKSFKSKESDEEISRWIEERKRNYPTAKNIQHKAEDMKAKKLRGELVDEDSRKRRERLKEILAKQAELGVPVAEVPAYYMSDRYGSLKGKGAKGESSGAGPSENHRNVKRDHDRGHHVANGVAAKEEDKEPPAKVPRISDGSNGNAEPSFRVSKMQIETIKETNVTVEVKEDLETEAVEPDVIATDEKDLQASGKTSEKLCFFYKRGRCKKGNRCEFLHERRSKKKGDASAQALPKRAPTLLTKLLESDIRREKSHLLQSFRFFVNNMFLLEFPEKPLKFFEWQERNDGNSDAEVGRPDTEAQEIENGDGTGSDEDAETSHAEDDTGELTRLDGEAQEVEFDGLLDSEGETHDDAEDGVGTDEDDMESLHEEENSSDVETRLDEEEMDC